MITSITLSIAHFFINIFAGGRSTIKIGLFILFFICIAIIFYIKKDLIKENFKKINDLFWINIGLLYLWSFFLYLYFIDKYSLPFSKYVFTMANGEISSNVWYHSHLMKGVLAIILNLFGLNTLENMDAGGAYIDLVPNILFIIGFFILCTTLILTYLYLLEIKLKIQEKTKYQKIILLLIYSISLFSLIKTAIDGGIFHPDAILSVATLLFTNYILDKKDKLKTLFTPQKEAIFILILILISVVLIFTDTSYQVLMSYTYVLLITTLLFLYLKLDITKYLIVLFLTFSFFASDLDRSILNYENLKIKKGEEVHVFSYKQPSGIFKIKKQIDIGKGAFYIVSAEKETTVKELSKNTGSIPNMIPIAIPWQSCFSKGIKDTYYFNIYTENILPENLFQEKYILKYSKLKEIKLKNGWYDTAINVQTNPCTPRVLNILDETLRENIGNAPYFLINPRPEELN